MSRRPRRKRAPLGPRYVGSIGGPDLRGDLYDIGSKADMAAAVLETARRSGCDCDPDITVPDEIGMIGFGHVRVAHDSG